MMMKRNFFLKICVSLLLVLSLMCAVGAVTVFAEPEDGEGFQQEGVVGENPQEQDVPFEEQQTPEEQQEPEAQIPPEAQQEPEIFQEEQPQDNQWYDYIYSYDEDADSSYEEPQYLGELPQADPEQVVEATAVPMPTVTVSDASLFSGIVMWMCVALGIAVIVGVLVSKRTRRRGA